jgi:hypothetical protein
MGRATDRPIVLVLEGRDGSWRIGPCASMHVCRSGVYKSLQRPAKREASLRPLSWIKLSAQLGLDGLECYIGKVNREQLALVDTVGAQRPRDAISREGTPRGPAQVRRTFGKLLNRFLLQHVERNHVDRSSVSRLDTNLDLYQ